MCHSGFSFEDAFYFTLFEKQKDFITYAICRNTTEN
jgi:hypothetical protein